MPQVNKRVETKTFSLYDQADEYRLAQLETKAYSKVKVIARVSGYDVASYLPLEDKS